ncbi:transcriptional regulator [Flexivirga endophytica]|uniref:Transcriptional regulator n=1 Tax=Flexivirga endophytica TaxID=1849103 RepID=A0A916TFK0_9MICO|nr:TetR/AcrR family transcriptional regulator C-terminal domain-containing protein [Flexivirga endophytica]GGB42139.1 transcriptional regulator [Flexivirga endophytica]GHB69199.1 transcriptional regulator [Flexivirga endophytica]
MPMDELPPAPWRQPKKAARPKRTDKPALSREAIVAKALDIIDAEGVDAVSMRRVATEFGTGAASLYAHVAGKSELLAAAYELALTEVDDPDPDQPWQDMLREFAWGMYQLLRRHRDLAKLSFADIPTGPRALDGVEKMLSTMIDQGVSPRDATWLFDRLALYIGADAFEGHVLRERFGAADGDDAAALKAGTEWIEQVRGYFAQLPPERYPTVTANLDVMMNGDSEERFSFGVEVLIAGIEARNPASRAKR